MNPKTRWLIVVVLILGLASLACATLTGGDTPSSINEAATAAVETGEQAATQLAQITPEVNIPPVETEPTPTPSGDTEPAPGGGSSETGTDSLDLSQPSLYLAPEGVNTYRTRLEFTFSGQTADGTAVTGSILGEGAASVDPSKLSLTFQVSNSSVPGETIQIVQTDNMIYMTSAEIGCFSLPAGEGETDNPYEELLDTGGALTGQAQRLQPDETINDIPVYVYEITNANLDISDPTSQQVQVITFGRVYVAKDGGYIVRVVMDGQGKNNTLTNNPDLIGDIHYQVDYFAHNQPVDIKAPENCAGSTPGDTGDSGGGIAPTGSLPVPENVSDLASFSGITSFTSDQTVEDLTNYYKTEMAAAGWTLDSELSISGVANLVFSQDGKTANVTITADPATGKTQVLIVEG